MLFVSGLLLDETILTGIEIDAAFGVSSIAEEIARAAIETDDFGVCSTGTD